MRHITKQCGGIKRVQRMMNNVKKTIITTTTAVAVVGACGVGCYMLGVNNEANNKAQLLNGSEQNQIVAEQGFTDLKAERFVKAIEQNTELVLTTENGMSEIQVEKYADGWNKFLTNSKITMSVEYRAKVSIKTEDITFIDMGDNNMMVILDQDDFEVSSIEIINKNILLNRRILGQSFSEDEKVVLERKMIESVREQIMKDSQSMAESKESLYSYLIEVGNTFGVNLEVVCK